MDPTEPVEAFERSVQDRVKLGWGRRSIDGNPYAPLPGWLFDDANEQAAREDKRRRASHGPSAAAEEYLKVHRATQAALHRAAITAWEAARPSYISATRQKLLPPGALRGLLDEQGLVNKDGRISARSANSVFQCVASRVRRRGTTPSRDEQLTLWFLCAELLETASSLDFWTIDMPTSASERSRLSAAVYEAFERYFERLCREQPPGSPGKPTILTVIEEAVVQAAEYERARRKWGHYADMPPAVDPEMTSPSDEEVEAILGPGSQTKSAIDSILSVALDDISKTLSWPRNGLPMSIRYVDPNTPWKSSAVLTHLFQFHAFQHFLRGLDLAAQNAPNEVKGALLEISTAAKSLPEITDFPRQGMEEPSGVQKTMEAAWPTVIDLLKLSDQLRDTVRRLAKLAAEPSSRAAITLGLIRYSELFYRSTRHEHQRGFTGGAALLTVSSETSRAHVRVPAPSFAMMSSVIKSATVLKTTGRVRAVGYSDRGRKQLYSSLISQLSLAQASAVLAFFQPSVCSTVTVDVTAKGRNPATGIESDAPMSSVVITRTNMESLDLNHVDPVLCLKALGARVTAAPEEHKPIRPFDTLDRDDPRIVQAQDILSDLDTRPNLMDLTPGEFESMVQNLFEKMGLDTEQTRPSRDGGVDAIAFDPRPLLGGKIVIQAKRYKNTVGVAAVRDLFGTMTNEGASKGILVTTSRYGSASFEFAKGKPLELIDGPQLLFLLKEYSDVEAKIVMPDNGPDPINTIDY